MNTRAFSTLLVVLSLALGCKNNPPPPPPTPTPAATASPVANSAPTPAGVERLAINTAASSVGFTGAKVTGRHEGRFTGFSGTIDLDPADVTHSRIDVTIQMSTLQIEPERLAGHLRTADFFDVARFPTSSFVSRSIEARAENGATHLVVGDLTMHGVTHEVRIPATITVTPSEARAVANFSINRRDWNIVYAGMADDLIRDQVEMRLDIRAPRAAH